MKKTYCIKCEKYRKSKNLEISYLFDEKFVIYIICGKCGIKRDN